MRQARAGFLQSWQPWLVSGAFLVSMTACYNRGTTSASMFPIKSGELWEAQLTTAKGMITTNFQLKGAPTSDSSGVEGHFSTTNGVRRGLGEVLLSSNLFLTYFWLSDEKYDFVSCEVHYAENLEQTTTGFAGFIADGTSRTLKDGCTLKRIR